MKARLEPQIAQSLIDIINEYLSVDIRTKSRKQEIVNGRMIYFKLLRELHYNYAAIAKSMGKNHATVIHAIKTLNNYLEYDAQMIRDYELIRDIFFDSHGLHPLHLSSRQELISRSIHLEKEIKSLNLFITQLKDSLNNYKKYDAIFDLLKERSLKSETLGYVEKKLNHILNGIQR